MADVEYTEDPTANPGPGDTGAPSSHLWLPDLDEQGNPLDTSAAYDEQVAFPCHMLMADPVVEGGRVLWKTVCGLALNDPDRSEILRTTDDSADVTCPECS